MGGAPAAHLQALLQAEGGLAPLLLALLRGAGALGLRRPLQAAHIILRRALRRPLHCSTGPQLSSCLQIQPTVACFAGDSTSARLGRGFLSW